MNLETPSEALRQWFALRPTIAGDAALAIALTTAGGLAAAGLYAPLGDTRLAMVMLLPVLFAGLLGGLRAALIAAAAAYFTYSFFFVPPAHSLKVAQAGDALTLAVFVIAAAIAGAGPGLLRDEQRRAAARARMMLAIIESNDFFTVTPNEDAIRRRLAEGAAAMTHTGAAVTNPSGRIIHRAGPARAWKGGIEGEIEALAKQAMTRAGGRPVSVGALRACAPRSSGEAVGAVIWLRPEGGVAERRGTEEHIALLADLAARAIGRARRRQGPADSVSSGSKAT